MTKKQTIQLLEEKKVRAVWDDEQEKCFFNSRCMWCAD